MTKFVPGWSPDHAVRAQAALVDSGHYCSVNAPAKAPRPAVSLSHFRSRYLDQGMAGSCWVHSPTQLFEVTAKVQGFTPFHACRRQIGWAAKALYEGGGNIGQGGSPTDAITAMTAKGVGIGHEEIAPYPVIDSEDGMLAALAVQPPQAAFDDAKKSHLVAPVRVRSLDEVVTLIDAGHPVANGFPCPAALQRQGITFIGTAGPTLGGHSILLWGYTQPGIIDGSKWRWFEMENWWGKIYRPLDSSLAKRIDGYVPVSPDATTSCWIREDAYLAYCAMDGGYAEHISATGIDGLTKGTVTPASNPASWFPV